MARRLAGRAAGELQITDHDAAQASCYTELRNTLLLQDFELRRAKFHEQSRDGHVLLWVVVIITLSGVALSALQLFASFRLAGGGAALVNAPGEFSIERGKVSLKSSVTGLFILLFSFAFFALFVSEVYRVKEIQVGYPPAAAGAAATPEQVAPGLLTPAPTASAASR